MAQISNARGGVEKHRLLFLLFTQGSRGPSRRGHGRLLGLGRGLGHLPPRNPPSSSHLRLLCSTMALMIMNTNLGCSPRASLASPACACDDRAQFVAEGMRAERDSCTACQAHLLGAGCWPSSHSGHLSASPPPPPGPREPWAQRCGGSQREHRHRRGTAEGSGKGDRQSVWVSVGRGVACVSSVSSDVLTTWQARVRSLLPRRHSWL